MSHHLAALVLIFLLFFSSFLIPSHSSTNSFIFGGCSEQKYTPGSSFESNLNSLLTSLVNSATYSSYNKFTILGSTSQDVVYGLYQCRGDLSMPDCAMCVAHSISQIGTLCPDSTGGTLQLQGCFVKYDNTTFLGVEDKSVLLKKCGPSYNQEDLMSLRDAVLAGLASGGGPYRVGGSGKVQGVAQCVGDLSGAECQDCVAEAIGRLKSECVAAVSGDVFLGKCYARYSAGSIGGSVDSKSTGSTSGGGSSRNYGEKAFAIIIGLLAGVALLIVFFSFVLTKVFGGKGK
ncbi:hypothetical protein AQUCO_03400240v1 [Aquilegia coerulea]|uniref:Gnk2-homologous domain-containing protein n=1 Tax=Aquilegia coerulea TaxID=218851 RepID=A0A2G5CZ38_AQUCA|nr:hypothetical protein AQUCO_03400240v1 [Aquilegia coerulea]